MICYAELQIIARIGNSIIYQRWLMFSCGCEIYLALVFAFAYNEITPKINYKRHIEKIYDS
ncbi:MAG: hypothetical protein LUI07_02345, partial [Lachnospiraceae bacterium]|nr:hypothetical protein [Lachnospiraceae bacterium]